MSFFGPTLRTRGFIAAGGMALVLAAGWAKVHRERMRLSRDAGRWRQESRELQQQRAADDASFDALEQKLSEFQQRSAITLTAAERARPNVGGLIERLKTLHAVKPPPIRIPPPPQGPSGMFFPELMSDPEYRRCYALFSRSSFENREGSRLRQLGLPAASVEQIIDLMVERKMQSLMNNGKALTAGSSLREKMAGIDRDIRNLIGDKYAEYEKGSTSSDEGLTRSRLGKLQYRLIYSDAPLQPSQLDALVTAIAPNTKKLRSDLFANEEVFPQELAQATLSAAQFKAFLAVREEAQASELRSKLPKVETTPWNAPKG